MDSAAEGKHVDRRTHGGDTDDHKLQKSWKQVLDEKLHRLHSLQFGVEHAMQKGDVETALTIGICLIGFLESECQSHEGQRAFISPIMDRARQRIDAVREESASVIDRRAFEQANCDKAQVFKKISSVDLDKIKQSKYFAPFFGSGAKAKQSAAIDCGASSPKVGHRPGGQQRGIKEQETSMSGTCHMSKVESSREGISKACKYLTQAKLTTLYGGAKCSDAASTRPAVKGAEDQKTNEGHIIAKGLRSSYDKNHTVLPVFVISDEEKEQQKFPQKIKKPFQSEDCYVDCAEVRHSVAKRRKGFHSEEVDGASQREELKNDMDGSEQDDRTAGFVTAKQKWAMDSVQKRNSTSTFSQPSSLSISTNPATLYHARGTGPKTLGMSRRGVRGQFIPPIRPSGGGGGGYAIAARNPSGPDNGLDESTRRCMELLVGADGELPDKLKNVEPRLIEHISNEIMDQDPNVRWDDIAGLEHAKKCVTEMVIWPLLRPDIFQGCRSPGKGLLLFGPPGTGKTMIGKAIAGEAKATFFSISASSLTSKWIGEGEKLVRALFGVASCRQPAVIFIDEIDSLLSQRKADGEHESSRRLKTQFLIEMEGCGSGNDQLLLIGATNRPQELDEAARRRLSKRLYIPLPSAEARAWIVQNLLKKDGLFTLSETDISTICAGTEGYSGSDMSNLVKEASMGPLREALMQGIDINKLKEEEMRPVMLKDFENALHHVKPSVSQSELGAYEDWNRQFGSHSI